MAEPETQSAKPIDRQSSTLSRWTPSLPTNLMSVLNPFSSDDSDRTNPDTTQTSNKRASILSSFLPANPSSAAPAATPAQLASDDDSTMFAEPETRSNSDEGSREGSVDESGRRKPKKSSKPKTCYSICHPPPTSAARQRLHRRPRSLMQLHRLCSDARPKPAFEVIPSANFSVKMTKATTKLFKTKHSACPNDLVVLKAEKYVACEPDEEQEARDIIALICKGRKDDGQAAGKARICFPDGREWEAYPTPNSGYEFFTTDEHGLGITVRWVPKRKKDGSKPSAGSSDRRFNFSTISPNSRRHPVIATLCKESLDINDSFKIPEPSAATPLSTPLQTPTLLDDAMDEEGFGKDYCETDDRLREIITMTGIWVALKEGWSPFVKCDDKEKDVASLQRSPSMQPSSPSPSKAATFAYSPVSSPPGSPPPPSPGLEKRGSIKSVGGIPRKSGLFSKINRASTGSLPEELPEQATSPATKKKGRTRADSASTVLVHRAASNRVKNQQQASWRVEMLSSKQEMREQPSTEELGRSQSDSEIEIPLTPQDSVARPILPSAPNSSNSGREVKGEVASTTSPSRGRKKSPQEPQRRSTANSETTTSASEASRKPVKVVKPKRSVLRKLLCGSG